MFIYLNKMEKSKLHSFKLEFQKIVYTNFAKVLKDFAKNMKTLLKGMDLTLFIMLFPLRTILRFNA